MNVISQGFQLLMIHTSLEVNTLYLILLAFVSTYLGQGFQTVVCVPLVVHGRMLGGMP